MHTNFLDLSHGDYFGKKNVQTFNVYRCRQWAHLRYELGGAGVLIPPGSAKFSDRDGAKAVNELIAQARCQSMLHVVRAGG